MENNLILSTFENRLKEVKQNIIKKLRVKEYLDINKEQEYQSDDDDEDFKGLNHNEDESESIKVYLKDFFLDMNTKFVMKNIVPKLDHGNDGVIFTLNDWPYYPGTWQHIIKWKPAVMNSVDFSLKLITSYSDSEYVWGLYTRTFEDPSVLYDWIFFSTDEENEKWRLALKTSSPIILECAYDHDLNHKNLLKF